MHWRGKPHPLMKRQRPLVHKIRRDAEPDGYSGVDVGPLGGDGGPVRCGRPRVLHQRKVDEGYRVSPALRHALQVRTEYIRHRLQHLRQDNIAALLSATHDNLVQEAA